MRTQALSLAAIRVWVVATFPTAACWHAATAAAAVVFPVFHLGHAFGERSSVFRVLRLFIYLCCLLAGTGQAKGNMCGNGAGEHDPVRRVGLRWCRVYQESEKGGLRYICTGTVGFGLACFDGIVGLGDTVVVVGASRHV